MTVSIEKVKFEYRFYDPFNKSRILPNLKYYEGEPSDDSTGCLPVHLDVRETNNHYSLLVEDDLLIRFNPARPPAILYDGRFLVGV